jgi:predicted ABC-type ATPase
MFAGPNGSGKSTLKSVLPSELLGIYINPDEIQRQIEGGGSLTFVEYGVQAEAEPVLAFFRQSSFLQAVGLSGAAKELSFRDGQLIFPPGQLNAYFASVAADFLRQKLLEKKTSFTFETVMSSSDKVALLKKARAIGYRTYLYYIATDDPDINISRVRHRILQGGHSVPEDKIVSRYHRSLGLLLDAIRQTDRAYVFDNSGDRQDRTWIAEISGGQVLEPKTDAIPAWFRRAVLDKLTGLRDEQNRPD